MGGIIAACVTGTEATCYPKPLVRRTQHSKEPEKPLPYKERLKRLKIVSLAGRRTGAGVPQGLQAFRALSCINNSVEPTAAVPTGHHRASEAYSSNGRDVPKRKVKFKVARFAMSPESTRKTCITDKAAENG